MKRIGLVFCGALLASAALAGDWRSEYETGLKSAHAGRWVDARNAFMKSESLRHKDSDRPTMTPDNPSDPTLWRSGAPYSPNFLAAYSEYRLAMDCKDSAEQTREFLVAQTEFQHLVTIGQDGRATTFYLQMIDGHLDAQHKSKLVEKAGKHKSKHSWKVDEECIPAEELSAMELAPPSNAISAPPLVAKTKPGDTKTIGEQKTGAVAQAFNSGPVATPGVATTGVPKMPDKFALVIGEDSAQLGSLGCASYDAKMIRDGLVEFAGYDGGNVTLIQNATSASILDQAKALSGKVSQDAIVFVFYAGTGSSIQGRDYLGASDTTSRYDTETMISKSALYSLFLQKGAKIFSFYEVNRPIENGYFFGSEVPQVGSVSQMEATIPDADVTATVANGHAVGLYANSFVSVLAELRSNRVPIYEFGWQLYNKMKRGNTGSAGGGGHQIPTLPVLNNLASDARF